MACVPGSEVEQRRGSAREAFDVADVATGDELITPETPPRTVADRFAATGTLVGLSIPPELDRGALEAIARAHAGHAHGTCVLDLVVAHPACDAALLSLVLELGAGSSQVANTVATSGKATVEQIRALHASDVASVREHAELALLEHELRGASPETFVEILHRYRDHETLGYAVRHRLATHPETPRTILQELASSQDAIGELARYRLPVDDDEWSPFRVLDRWRHLRAPRPMRILVCVPGSEVDRWRRAARGAFDVIKATTWAEALAETRIDVGFVFFHLAERLGLQPTNDQSAVHQNPGHAGPRRLVTSPKLPSALTRDPGATIKRHVLEALAATAAAAEGHTPGDAISTIGFLGSDLGGHSDLSIADRARAVAEAISEYHALLG